MQAASAWTGCRSSTACGQCVAAQAILKRQLHAHASAACILGDGLLVAALQHHVRGHIRKNEAEALAAWSHIEAQHVTKRLRTRPGATHDRQVASSENVARPAPRIASRHGPKTVDPATAAHGHAVLAPAPAPDRVRHGGARTVGTGLQAQDAATALTALGAPSRTRTRTARCERTLHTRESL